MAKNSIRVLVVDDSAVIREMLADSIKEANGVELVATASGGKEALTLIDRYRPDVVSLDIQMPGIDGFETCRQLKTLPAKLPPAVIMVTGKSALSEQSKAFVAGADDYMIKPVDSAELSSRVELHFRLRESQRITEALQQKVDSNHVALKRAARERIEQTIAVQDVAVFTLAKVAESRDNETGEHIERMREYSQLLAQELSSSGPYANEIDENFLADLYRSTPLHDIGKVGIPDSILLKPGQLSSEEFEVMKRHTVIGSNILQHAVTQLTGGGFLTMAAMIAKYHHERWNGTGYPTGLAAEKIPLAARIASVADVYDALTSNRPYKDAWSPVRAKQTIDDAAGTQFDPAVVAAFDHRFEDIVCIQLAYADRNPAALVVSHQTAEPTANPVKDSFD